MAGPVKQSVTVRGHRTSVSLEPVFWEALREIAAAGQTSIGSVIAEVDEERSKSGVNLSSAVRTHLFEYYRALARPK